MFLMNFSYFTDDNGNDAERARGEKMTRGTSLYRSKNRPPSEATDKMVARGLEESLAIMKEHGVDGLSPFSDYPSPSETIRRVYRAMIAAALMDDQRGEPK